LIQIDKETDNDWRERKWRSNLYMEQTVTIRLVQVQTVIVYIRRAVDNVAV